MVCVNYEVYKKTGELVMKNFGWFDSKEIAIKTLHEYWDRVARVVIQ